MQCPKCGAEQAGDRLICSRCGIVFAKYFKYHPRTDGDDPRPPAPAAPVSHARPSAGAAPRPRRANSLLLSAAPGGDWFAFSGRAVLWALLLAWGLVLMLAPVEGNAVGASYLRLVNLPFHEFGHILFRRS